MNIDRQTRRCYQAAPAQHDDPCNTSRRRPCQEKDERMRPVRPEKVAPERPAPLLPPAVAVRVGDRCAGQPVAPDVLGKRGAGVARDGLRGSFFRGPVRFLRLSGGFGRTPRGRLQPARCGPADRRHHVRAGRVRHASAT
ncbi:MAG: hypothetical protein MZV70_50560 [Desulfobacterales bacterium]|nr:hypothetical protein [Desulfobacterales bacterium]